MCGIAGIVGPLAERRDLVATMLVRIRHRGPNGEGTHFCERIAFAHSRLSIIDLSDAAAQPMHDPAAGNVVVFNGEIYNFADLAAELGPAPSGMSSGDTAVLLRAYGHWGIDAVQRLRGMFAFAMWDPRERKVLLARDRFGMKPLYYRQVGSSLLFASEIRPLLFGEFPHSANLDTLARFLAFRHLDASNETCFKEIRQVPAAHYAWVDLDGSMSQPRRYWSPPAFGTRPFRAEDASIVRDAVTDSVAKHMVSDVPVGVFVSGGIDSASIACTARGLIGDEELSSFSSILPDETSNAENRLIPAVLDAIRSRVHSLEIDGNTFLDDLPAAFDCHEEPMADASMYAHWRLCRLAQQAGIRVLLSGNGGDELFGGYMGHVYAMLGSLLRRGRVGRFAASIDAYRRFGMGSGWSLLKHGFHESMPLAVRVAIKRRYAAHVLRGSAFESYAAEIPFYYSHERDVLVNRFHDNVQHWCVPPFVHYEDRNGMAFGVEIRTPFIDHELLAAVWQYDPRTLMEGRSKHALRQAMHGIVPAAVLDQRTKFGFAAPLDVYMHATRDRLSGVFRDVVGACPYFDVKTACRQLDAYFAGAGSVTLPWRIFSVALWYARFIGRLPPSPASNWPAVSASLAG
jgi:asparagine synthase (glutamine-hydrolysing)